MTESTAHLPEIENAAPSLTIELPPQRYIDFPPDVAQKNALRKMLSETDIFGHATAEAQAYLDGALERFRITMALIPDLPPGAAVLELGANPYFITRLLRQRGHEVQAANWFGEGSGFGDRGCQRVFESGIPQEYQFDHFNIESATFPYEESSFDLVLFCEILEHLPYNPTHTLVEIHRVLRDGGRMLLTTPNANRLENLVKVQRGENMYEPLSGYGVYGRHNREYTVSELCDLLDGCGFVVDDIFAQDLLPPPVDAILAGASLEHRGENLFVLAHTGPTYRWYYPAWLYQSVHGFRRVVRPDLVVGFNCDLQATGLHYVEEFAGRPGRWTIGGSEASALICSPSAGPGLVRIEGRTPEIGGSIEIHAALGLEEFSWTLDCDGSAFDLKADASIQAGEQTIRLWSDRAWRPCELGHGLDERTLGFVVHQVSAGCHFGTPTARDVVIGSNCDVQLTGVHPLEEVAGLPARWTNGSGVTLALLVPEVSGPARLTIEGWTPDIAGDLRLFAEVRGQTCEWLVTADGEPFLVSETVNMRSGEEIVRLWTDRPWRPREEKQELDERTLGLLLRSIRIESLAVPAPPRSAPNSLARRAFRKLPPPAQSLARRILKR